MIFDKWQSYFSGRWFGNGQATLKSCQNHRPSPHYCLVITFKCAFVASTTLIDHCHRVKDLYIFSNLLVEWFRFNHFKSEVSLTPELADRQRSCVALMMIIKWLLRCKWCGVRVSRVWITFCLPPLYSWKLRCAWVDRYLRL